MTLAREDTAVTWTEPGPAPLRGNLFVLPGRGESAAVYERFGRRIATDAYRVHVIGTAPSDSAETAYDQLAGLIDAADPDLPRVVVGSDAGATYAAHLAATGRLAGADALILAGLLTAAAAAPARGWEDELEARTFCSTHRGRITEGGVRPGALFDELPGDWFAPGHIDLPVLGVHGRADPISPIEQARAWYAAVPRAELIGIEGAPHDVLNDQTHRTVAASVVLFLERLRGGAAAAPIAIGEPIR